eukprot:c14483_g1_i1 orf=404-874(+)
MKLTKSCKMVGSTMVIKYLQQNLQRWQQSIQSVHLGRKVVILGGFHVERWQVLFKKLHLIPLWEPVVLLSSPRMVTTSSWQKAGRTKKTVMVICMVYFCEWKVFGLVVNCERKNVNFLLEERIMILKNVYRTYMHVEGFKLWMFFLAVFVGSEATQ